MLPDKVAVAVAEFRYGSLAASPHQARQAAQARAGGTASTRRSDYQVITASTIIAAEPASWPLTTAPAFTGHDGCEHHLSLRRLTDPLDMAVICAWCALPPSEARVSQASPRPEQLRGCPRRLAVQAWPGPPCR